jgi:hypothetical protein
MFGQTCEVFMNEHEPSSPPPIIEASPSPDVALGPPTPPQDFPRPFTVWLRKLFACNPFYLLSAALLLFGCYRVSIDAPLLNVESARLLFNFTSVQLYEVLLVFTAIFLARRCLWYDSTLLAGLENLLVFVPFILISQAALIDSHMALEMSLAGGAVAVLRFGSLKHFFNQLNLPGRLLAPGFILLALNVALPLIYRHFGETKIGVHIDSGPAYVMNECTWLLILPAVLALANVLPHARAEGSLLPQHRWLPAGLFALWIAVTGTHLYGLDYVYQFDLRSELFAPAAWVLAWTGWRRFSSDATVWANRLKYALIIPPVFAPFFSTSPGGQKTFLILTALNVAAYGGICCLNRRHPLARHLLFASALMLFAALPETWMESVTPGVTRAGCVAAGLTTYLILAAALLRNPKLAMLGAFLLGSAVAAQLGQHANTIHWAFQSGLVFLLLHSLRWNDAGQPEASAVRAMAGLAWVLQSFVWMNSGDGKFWRNSCAGHGTASAFPPPRRWSFSPARPAPPPGASGRCRPDCWRSSAAFCSSGSAPLPRSPDVTGTRTDNLPEKSLVAAALKLFFRSHPCLAVFIRG